MATITLINAIRNHEPSEVIEKCRAKKVVNWWDVQEFVTSGSDALQLAVTYSHKEYVEYLLNNFIHECLNHVCCPIILLAIKMGADDLLEAVCKRVQEEHILSHGVPYIDARGCALDGGRSPIHEAVQLGRASACRILLKYGANPHATDMYGLTALERGLQSLILSQDEQMSFCQNASMTQLVSKHPVLVDLKHKSRGIVACLLEVSDFMICTDKESVPYLRGLLKDCFTNLPPEYAQDLVHLNFLMEKLFRPPSLVRMSRFSIRTGLGYGLLPNGVNKLGLPSYLADYILHNIKEQPR